MKKYINHQDMRQANAIDVLSLIREHPGVTRRQIADLTELSWGAVSNITAHLLEEQYIIETKCESTGAGRTPQGLEVNGREHFVLGLDINSSGLCGVVMNLKNEPITELRRCADFTDAKELLRSVTEFALAVKDAAGAHSLLCAGVAMQGLVDAEHGISQRLPQCPAWQGVPLARYLSDALALPVHLEHDPNCLLYAWSRQAEYDDALLLRVDDGIGMSVMLGGRILSRPGMFEIGHQTAVPGGIRCTCGRSGCLEAYASMRGIAVRAGLPFPALAEKAVRDEQTRSFFTEAAQYLANAVCDTAQLLNVRDVVLCGDMWQYAELWEDAFLKEADTRSQGHSPIFHKTTTDNAACGAALIALERSLDQL